MNGRILSELSTQREVKNILTVRGLDVALNALHQSFFLLFFVVLLVAKQGGIFF